MERKIKGFTLKIWRGKSLVGWSDIYYSCFRDADRFELCSGCGSLLGADNFWSVYRYIKKRIEANMGIDAS